MNEWVTTKRNAYNDIYLGYCLNIQRYLVGISIYVYD